MAAGFPALGHDDFDTVAYGPPCRFDIADLLPHRHAGIAEEGQVLGRRVTPVERGDRHFLFGADADLGVIVKTGDEIDIEGRIGGRADPTDDGPNFFRWCKPHPESSDPAPSPLGRGRQYRPQRPCRRWRKDGGSRSALSYVWRCCPSYLTPNPAPASDR